MMLVDHEPDDVRHIEIPLHILPITIVHICYALRARR
jgi:hypothetical protein